MSWDFAGAVLMRGFRQDDEVAKAIADVFRRECYPAHSLLGWSSDWTPLVQSFEGHALLCDAVDDWLETREKLFWDYQLCLISRSPRAKNLLLKASGDTGVIGEDQARALLAGWGMSDPDAAEALSKLAESSVAPRVANLLPDILNDRETFRRRLLEWLRGGPDQVAGPALIGLIELGNNNIDTEVADAAVAKFAGHVPSGMRWWGVSDVISNFPHHAGVRELALLQVRNRGGDIGSVAAAFADDPQVRGELLQQLHALPSDLRAPVVDRLARYAPEDDFAHRVLSDYDDDVGEQVKVSAAIGYARSVATRNEDQAALTEKLSQCLRVSGLDHIERRQAALAGLIELDRLDIVVAADRSKDGSLRLMRVDRHPANLRLASQLVKQRERLRGAFGAAFWERVGHLSDEFLEAMASQVTDDDLLNQLVEQMEKNTGASPSVASLRVRSRRWRGTNQLRDLCFDVVRRFGVSDWIHTAPGIFAAEILSEQFDGDTTAKQQLEAIAATAWDPSAVIVGLCGAWPDSPALEPLWQKDRREWLLPAQCHLLCRFSDPEEFVARLGGTLPQLSANIWEFLPSCAKAILGRFDRDAQVREMTFQRLEAGASGAEKGNLPVLLRRTDTRIDRLMAWCREEYRRQISGAHLPDFALDIFTGGVRPVGHVLLELLSG